MKLFFTLIIICCFLTFTFAQTRRNPSLGGLVEHKKPAVFISFLRSAEIEPLETGVTNHYVWFRITNNTKWAIWLDMSEAPKAYGDAILYYTIEGKDDGKIQIDSRCHVCSTNPLGSGRSLVFSIPRDYVSEDTRMRINYTFQWERDHEDIGGSSSTHSVEFYFSYLPKSVLQIGKASNNRMQRSAQASIVGSPDITCAPADARR